VKTGHIDGVSGVAGYVTRRPEDPGPGVLGQRPAADFGAAERCTPHWWSGFRPPFSPSGRRSLQIPQQRVTSFFNHTPKPRYRNARRSRGGTSPGPQVHRRIGARTVAVVAPVLAGQRGEVQGRPRETREIRDGTSRVPSLRYCSTS